MLASAVQQSEVAAWIHICPLYYFPSHLGDHRVLSSVHCGIKEVLFSSIQFTQLCPTPCNTMNCSTPGFPVHHQLLELANPCPLSQRCHPTISSSVVPSSSSLQYFPASECFPISQIFASSGQSIGVSASAVALLMNIQDWFPLRLTGWISLQSKALSRVFSNTTVQKHQFFSAQLS